MSIVYVISGPSVPVLDPPAVVAVATSSIQASSMVAAATLPYLGPFTVTPARLCVRIDGTQFLANATNRQIGQWPPAILLTQ